MTSGRRQRRSHGKERGAGRAPKRPLAHGDLRLLILSLLDDMPRHGYDLIGEIEKRTQGAYKPSPGVMYPALEVVQDLGWTRIEADGGRKIFHLTDEGRQQLANEAENIAAIHRRLDHVANPPPDENDDVRTALRRLRHTVVTRIRETNGEARREAIAEIVEAARKKIEDMD